MQQYLPSLTDALGIAEPFGSSTPAGNNNVINNNYFSGSGVSVFYETEQQRSDRRRGKYNNHSQEYANKYIGI